MNFADGLQKAYETKWSFVNTFNVQFAFTNEMIKDEIGWDEARDGININLHIVSIDTPQLTNQPIEAFVANRWVIHNGRDELYRFSITFRDSDSMSLYRKFVRLYQKTREDYFDHVKFTVLLTKEADWYNQLDKILFQFQDTIIESVSQLQFNNTTENQIAEFTVNFKTTFPNLEAAKTDINEETF